MKLPEHRKEPKKEYCAVCKKWKSNTLIYLCICTEKHWVFDDKCEPNCPRCAVDKALAEQKAEMIAEVRRNREELMWREEVSSDTIENRRFRAGYLTALHELLKGWKEG